MTLTYGGYNLAEYAAKYGVIVVPRIVQGPNPIDSIAGTHDPDDLAHKLDIVIQCRALSADQLNVLWTLAQNAIDVPYQNLLYEEGSVHIDGRYRIEIGQSDPVILTSERKLFGGVIITLIQR